MSMDDPQPNTPKDAPQSEPTPSNSTSFWVELKRRKVVRVAITYAVVAWVVIQIAVATFPSLLIPVWALRLVIMSVLLGFPVALILAWAFELTPEGIKTTRSAQAEQGNVPLSENQQMKRNWFSVLFAAAIPTFIFGSLAVFFYLRSDSDDSAPQEDADGMSIAVLPLINMSAEEDNRYFADGVHEEILTYLSRIEGLNVISRTTMLRYGASDMTLPEIAKASNSQYVVEGSVRRIGNFVRITVQLIDAAADHHLWANNFDRELNDVFAAQSELAEEISNSIHLEIQPSTVQALKGRLSSNPIAFDLYQKSISIEKSLGETEASTIQRRKLLEQAVEADPNFVEAWAQLKRMYDLMHKRIRQVGWTYGSGDVEALKDDLRNRSSRALAKAMNLDPNNVETLLARAVNHVEPVPPDVLKERKAIFDQIFAKDPKHPMALLHFGWWHFHQNQSDVEGAFRQFEKALESDPFNVRIVEAVMGIARSRRPEVYDELAVRLEQIVPETAEDRAKAKASLASRLSSAFFAFFNSGDIDFLDDMEALLIPEVKSNFRHVHSYHRYEILNYLIKQDWEKTKELALQIEIPVYDSGRDCEEEVYDFHANNVKAMSGLWNAGREVEAKELARRILAAQKSQRVIEEKSSEPLRSCAVGLAHFVLGDVEAARRQAQATESQVAESKDAFFLDSVFVAILAWARVDADRAVDLFMDQLSNESRRDLISGTVFFYEASFPILVNPKVREVIVEDGRWIDFLSERVPEFAALKNVSK